MGEVFYLPRSECVAGWARFSFGDLDSSSSTSKRNKTKTKSLRRFHDFSRNRNVENHTENEPEGREMDEEEPKGCYLLLDSDGLYCSIIGSY